MPAKDHLTLKQQRKLQEALKREENGEIRERILILLLLNDGKTQQEIAKFIGCSKNKVGYWCVHGDPDNLESLKDERMKGNHQKATEKYLEILLETIEKEPEELGYEFGRWSAQRLATYLEEKTGIKLSGSQVRRILSRKKYVYLWAKYSLESRRNPQKREAFKEKIETEMPQIHLEYLPEYSPDYNLIELVWHSAKEYIANRLFKSIEELEFLLHKLLNEGELIIEWGRKLKNKGNALITV
jgi:transposase